MAAFPFFLPLAFATPLVLGALVILPALWLLLRLTPPQPNRMIFPPLQLMAGLRPAEETPARTPWWLLLLRLALAACIILAMAGPSWNPSTPLSGEGGKGPLLLVLDDGWAAAPDWDLRIKAADARLGEAGRAGRLAALVTISDGQRSIVLSGPNVLAEKLRAIQPQPILPDRMAALPALAAFLGSNPASETVWISDGLESGNALAFTKGLVVIAKSGSISLLQTEHVNLAIAGLATDAGGLSARILRSSAASAETGAAVARDEKGRSLGQVAFSFASTLEARAKFDLPLELRNEIARIEIVGETSAGAVALVDERWKRRRIGLLSGAGVDVAQPLLSPIHYLTKALGPFADLREPRAGAGDPVGDLLDSKPDIMILADIGTLAGEPYERLRHFVEEGGLLLRFAGSRLAAGSDDLVPVKLRRGGRVLGGSLSWETPKSLAAFDDGSPFAGLKTPGEVSVSRQVLAEPEAGLSAKTWAALMDGTPLVTAARRGRGTIVLVHVTADTTWSNLPLSGLFVDMLRKIVTLAKSSTHAPQDGSGAAQLSQQDMLAPLRTLNGFGVMGSPPPTALPIPSGYEGSASADHPPGLYGLQDASASLNSLGANDQIGRADFSGIALPRQSLEISEPVDLRPALILAALLLFLADTLASLFLGGAYARFLPRRALPVTSLFLALILMNVLQGGEAGQAHATEVAAPAISQRDLSAALTTSLAYVLTGDARVDAVSRAGLSALSQQLAGRTSLNPGDPVGINPAGDELVFYPFIYWPVVPDAPQPPALAKAKIAAFMKQGGTVLFDTRDALSSRPGGPPTPEARWLRLFLDGVDVPELEPVPHDHVITKSFYLIDGFVGRFTSGQTWIEALPPERTEETYRPARAGDSVSPILITSNDLAGAWATDSFGQAMLPLVPGERRQREMALRGGINLIIYALTGNYKADQVHVRDLLNRLGH